MTAVVDPAYLPHDFDGEDDYAYCGVCNEWGRLRHNAWVEKCERERRNGSQPIVDRPDDGGAPVENGGNGGPVPPGDSAKGGESAPSPAVTTASAVPAVTSRRGSGPLDDARRWLARYITTIHDRDLDLLALWAAHTHYFADIGTSPRLLITSPLPASGKTTCLEHLARLSMDPVQMGSLSTPAMLARLLADRPRSILIDECQRNLHPKREGVGDLLAVLSTGYKRGATRPTTVPDGPNGWRVVELPTFSPVALAGLAPDLPDDIVTRLVTVLLLPDTEGQAEDSDWERIEQAAEAVGKALADWAEATELPDVQLPDDVTGRARERWRPLWRVAHAAGGDWPERCRELMAFEAENLAHDKEDGIVSHRPAVALLKDAAAEWPPGIDHWKADLIAQALRLRHPDRWGATIEFPQGLTSQRVGRYLSRNFGLRTVKASSGERLGYQHADVIRLARRLGLTEEEPR